MNAAITILSGFALLVLGQIVIRSLVDPIYELRKLRGEIADALIYYANVYMNPDPDREHENSETAKALRKLGTLLESRAHAVPFYCFFALVRAVPDWSTIEETRKNLIGLSNCLYRPGDAQHNETRRKRIKEALRLRIPD